MSQDSAPSSNGLKDAIITLPIWAIVMVALLCGGSLVLAMWLTVTSKNDGIKATSVQLLVLLVPLTSAVIASIAVRRTSTAQIDKLINNFLERTVLQRLTLMCSQSTNHFTLYGYPFSKVTLRESVNGQSYAYYHLFWKISHYPKALIGIKTNVFNFEIFTTLPIKIPKDNGYIFTKESWLINQQNIEVIQNHRILSHFFGLIQGSANEGYVVALELQPQNSDFSNLTGNLSIALRQKVRENFLTSPFLKRYFAEDAAIAVGVLFSEYQKSGLMPSAPH